MLCVFIQPFRFSSNEFLVPLDPTRYPESSTGLVGERARGADFELRADPFGCKFLGYRRLASADPHTDIRGYNSPLAIWIDNTKVAITQEELHVFCLPGCEMNSLESAQLFFCGTGDIFVGQRKAGRPHRRPSHRYFSHRQRR